MNTSAFLKAKYFIIHTCICKYVNTWAAVMTKLFQYINKDSS